MCMLWKLNRGRKTGEEGQKLKKRSENGWTSFTFFPFFFSLNWSYGSSDESSKILGKKSPFFFARGTRQVVPKTWRIWVFISEKEYGKWYLLMCVWTHASPDLWMQISDGS